MISWIRIKWKLEFVFQVFHIKALLKVWLWLLKAFFRTKKKKKLSLDLTKWRLLLIKHNKDKTTTVMNWSEEWCQDVKREPYSWEQHRDKTGFKTDIARDESEVSWVNTHNHESVSPLKHSVTEEISSNCSNLSPKTSSCSGAKTTLCFCNQRDFRAAVRLAGLVLDTGI